MDKIDLLEDKIRAAARMIQELREANAKMAAQQRKVLQENQMLLTENQQTRKLMADLDKLREERRLVRQKVERLVTKFDKLKI